MFVSVVDNVYPVYSCAFTVTAALTESASDLTTAKRQTGEYMGDVTVQDV